MTRIRTPERSARPAGSPRPAPRSAARPAAAPTPRRSFNLSLPTLTFGPRAQKATLILLAGAALAFVIVALTPPLVMAA
ncbi:MAG: hypothetical protein NTZ05_14595, partial [Chloroflexi bacterium]|nr:hypothetical protein [Chloroflexota bacterium]